MWSRTWFVLVCVALAGYVTYATTVDTQSAAKIASLRQQIADRAADNARLRVDSAELQRRILAVEKRPEVLERTIRTELGVIRQDEVIVSFPDEAR